VVRLAGVAQVVTQQRGVAQLLLDGLALVVQDAQRVDLRAAQRVLVQVQAAQEVLQRRAVDGTALLVAQAVEQDPEVAQAQRAVGLVGQDDQLGVERRVPAPIASAPTWEKCL
jgi:hypothetical protein